MSGVAVAREPAWIRGESVACLRWLHRSPSVPQHGCAAVICGPVGHEYTRAHRTLRHLADRLARAGIPALRFDYHGVGDSPGSDLDPGRLAAWEASVRAAIADARAATGCESVALVGVRLGATLAARVAADIPVDGLVLWNPVVKGRTFVRELQAIAMAAPGTEADKSGGEGVLECAGFVHSQETLDALKKVDLLAVAPRTRRALILGRDDLPPDEALATRLSSLGIACDRDTAPGWTAMMADHQFSEVPDEALEKIVRWLVIPAKAGTQPVIPAKAGIQPESEGVLDWVPASAGMTAFTGMTETLFPFGPDDSFFGVLARPDEGRDRPVVLMFNGGSVHHVGPNRIYVQLARRLAALGVPSLRFDMEGIGDSVLRGEGRENHPYQGLSLEEAKAAMARLRERFGYSQFVALGLCSGAHNAFHTKLILGDEAIRELVLINPVAFHWSEGMSLEGATRTYDALAYRKSMRDPSRWLKLLRGDVNFARLFQVAASYPVTFAKKRRDAFLEAFMPSKGPRLARDLLRLQAMGCPMTLVVSEGDPGTELLMQGAPRTAPRAIAAGHVRHETIAGADHTLTQRKAREALVERLAAQLAAIASADGAAIADHRVPVARPVATRAA